MRGGLDGARQLFSVRHGLEQQLAALVPAFLSTHPKDEQRLRALEAAK